VNGPETPVFSKRRTLYGLDLARTAVRNGATLVVVEGYMDVIAAAQSGFAGAVAPLGTALTAEQMEVLWGISASPVLCFDGDAAGARAAQRAMDLALPLLTPERSLKFATLPSGEDPDSLVRKGGPGRFQAVLDAAQSPSDALYDMVRGSAGDQTPEQRAALRSRLIEAAGRIADKSLAGEYRRVLLDRFFSARGQGRPRDTPSRFAGRRPAPQPVRFVRAQIDHSVTNSEWSRILTAILLHHPYLLHDVQTAYATLVLDDRLTAVRDALLAWAENAETLDFAGLMDHLTKSGCSVDIERILSAGAMPLPACALPSAMPAEAESGWWHFFGFLNVERLREEVALAKMDADRNLTSETERRLSALRQALIRVESGEPDGVGLVEA
jgi:DNA primase